MASATVWSHPLVFVQVGQCGNQLGAAVFDAVMREASSMPHDARDVALGRFFRPGRVPVARAVLIDTEPRVVRAALQAHPVVPPSLAGEGPECAPSSPAPTKGVAAASAPSGRQRVARRSSPPGVGRIGSILSRADAALDLALRGPRASKEPARVASAAPSSRGAPRGGAAGSRGRAPTAVRGRGRGGASNGLQARGGRPRPAPAAASVRGGAQSNGRAASSSGRRSGTGERRGRGGTGHRRRAEATSAAPGRGWMPGGKTAGRDLGATTLPHGSRSPHSPVCTTGQAVSVRAVVPGSVEPASPAWAFSPGRSLVRPGGAGNNWAIGYACLGPGIVDQAVRLVGAELRAADRLAVGAGAPRSGAHAEAALETGGIVLLQSLAGGTGSGVGAAVAEALRAAFPDTPLLAVAVGSEGHGAGGGAVCVGHMNTALSLDSLLSACDAVVLASNDDLASTASTALRDATPSLETLNSVLADRITALLLPATALARALPADAPGCERFSAPLRPQRRAEPLVHALRALGLWPRDRPALGRHAKLLTLALCPTVRANEATLTTCSWRAALRRARAAMLVGASSDTDTMCRTAPAVPSALDWAALSDAALAAAGGSKDMRPASAESELPRSMISRWHQSWATAGDAGASACIAAVVVCRGAAGGDLLAQVSPLLRLLEHTDVVCPSDGDASSSSPARLAALASPVSFMGLSASVVSLFSSVRSAEAIRRTVRRAASLVRAGAYLHHFCDRGVPETRLLAALSALWRDAERFHCHGAALPR